MALRLGWFRAGLGAFLLQVEGAIVWLFPGKSQALPIGAGAAGARAPPRIPARVDGRDVTLEGEGSFHARTDRCSAASLFALSDLSSFHPLQCKSSSTSRSERCAVCERRALCQDSRLPRGLPLELVGTCICSTFKARSFFLHSLQSAVRPRCSLHGPALLQVPGAQQSLQGMKIPTSVPEDARSTDAEKRPSWTAWLGSVQCRSQKANNEAAEHRPLCAVYRIAKFQQKLVHNPRQLGVRLLLGKKAPSR